MVSHFGWREQYFASDVACQPGLINLRISNCLQRTILLKADFTQVSCGLCEQVLFYMVNYNISFPRNVGICSYQTIIEVSGVSNNMLSCVQYFFIEICIKISGICWKVYKLNSTFGLRRKIVKFRLSFYLNPECLLGLIHIHVIYM